MVTTIIFDCWGTLFTSADHPHPFDLFAQKLGHSLNDYNYVKTFEEHLMKGAHDNFKEPIELIITDLGIVPSESLIKELEELIKQSTNSQIPYSDTMDNLLKLKESYTLVLLTNTYELGFEKLIKTYHLDNIFDHIITSYQMHELKPSPKLFESALGATHCSPKHALMVGDNLKDDIEPAKKLGLQTKLMDRRKKHLGIENRINNLNDLLDYLS